MVPKLKKKNLFWIFVVGIVIILLHYYGIISPLENLFFKAFSPLRNKVYSTSKDVNIFAFINDYKSLKKENEELSIKNINNIIDESYIKKLEEENEVLKKSLSYFENSNKEFVVAKVISGFNLESNNILVINRGSRHGIDIGMPVVFQEGVIVGVIIKVDKEFSDILLLSDKNSLITSTIYGQDKTNGIIKGDLDYGLEMDYIPIDTQINEGDIVVSAGLEKEIPNGLVIGQIKEVIVERGDFFKKAIVYPSVEYQNLNFVSVIKKF
ncbi:MAG: rod shape-determining protein MreC [Patescibacteria group bacterium]|nr:rod shape-determining protein MreC [Patescibacteria group bacterium]MDD4304453.1 rod shape-determining protein MreC [Patescibacteria group bacterium]MDD4695475.1 rod shape-determining protein MreC [Patescibacteria group bacterium]